jgi:sulfur-oxidizing protein SoxA
MSIRWALAVATALAALAHAAAAEAKDPAVRSASEFLSPDLKAEQQDDARNRGLLWVERGAELWSRPAGREGRACAACHGAAGEGVATAATRHPAPDTASGRLLTLEMRIQDCRQARQGAGRLEVEGDDLLALTAYVASLARGRPMAVVTQGPAVEAALALGRRHWSERQGQLNLACTQCHDDNVGRKLRGDTISSGIATGFPAYRLEWQGLGSLHRRLRACAIGIRAEPVAFGSDEHVALELYLAWRARGQPMEAPAVRR